MQYVSLSADSLIPFVCENVQQASTFITDCWKGYNQLDKHGYMHKHIYISESGDPEHVHFPGIH